MFPGTSAGLPRKAILKQRQEPSKTLLPLAGKEPPTRTPLLLVLPRSSLPLEASKTLPQYYRPGSPGARKVAKLAESGDLPRPKLMGGTLFPSWSFSRLVQVTSCNAFYSHTAFSLYNMSHPLRSCGGHSSIKTIKNPPAIKAFHQHQSIQQSNHLKQSKPTTSQLPPQPKPKQLTTCILQKEC